MLYFSELFLRIKKTFGGRWHNAELLLQALNRVHGSIYIFSSAHKRKKNVVSHLLQKNWRRLLPVTQSSLTSNIRKNEILWFSVFFEKGHVKID